MLNDHPGGLTRRDGAESRKLKCVRRRTLKTTSREQPRERHHNVYVVLLDPAVGRIRRIRRENPNREVRKPCVYVGMTGLTPEERFANHKQRIKAAWAVTR